MTLKQLRIDKGLTQAKCADILQVSLRTYKRYESNESTINTVKYQYLVERLSEYGKIDENHGILSIDQIQKTCSEVFKDYQVDYCYLFGSYAKGKETETSDIDLLIAMPINSMKYFELIELLRERLKKKIDLLDVGQLDNNPQLVNEILKDGIKIYG